MPTNEPTADRSPSAVRAPLERIPLPLRMLVYGAAFLAAVLIGVPWLAYRVDVAWPAWHFDFGPVRWLGLPIAAGCLAVYLWSSYLLSRHGRGAYVEFDPPKQFVAVGPFRWVRNPIAGSLVGVIAGEALLCSSTGILLLFLLSLPLAHAQVVLLEEPLLTKRFGDAYRDYLRRVPRWLPHPPREPLP